MSTKPVIIGVIPARYASQRLPAKPLVDLLGKSMVQRVYEQSKKAPLLDRVIVATDDKRVQDTVKRFGGDVMMTSPDIESGSDRVAVVALEVPGDIFVNIQGDEPLIEPELIDQVIQLLLDDTSAPVGTLVKKIDTHEELLNPNIVKVVLDHQMYALYFSRSVIPYLRDVTDMKDWIGRQTYYKHIGLYVFRKDFLMEYSKLPVSNLERVEKLEQLRILEAGYKIKVGITTFESVPVDTKEDIARVGKILQQISSVK